MLTTAEITAIRNTETLALPDTCTVSRKTLASDGRGGHSATWASVATNVACRLGRSGSKSGVETIDADALQQQTPWVVTFKHDQDVRNTDRIVIGARTFEVISVEPHGAWTMALRVQCVEVT